MREFLDGNTAIARAAIAAGCDFFAGYPITPATSILLAMMRDLPRVGGVAIQGEDEIASLGFCIGAALTGRRTFTATSGPGISLYSENIGLAIMGEVPLVIVDVQRMGPATGGATTAAQGDLQFIRWCTSGGYPVIALSPATVADCYTLTMRAFDLAERYRCPVFLLTDKEVATTTDTVDVQDLVPYPVRARETAPVECTFEPCDYPALDANVAMSPFGGPHLLRFTTSTHDERGYLTKDPHKVGRLNQHLARKILQHQDEIHVLRADIQEGARVLLISYGITARAMDSAVRMARARGRALSALTLLSLWPLPEATLRSAIANARHVVVAELSDGQLRREIERLACGVAHVSGVGRTDGELITPEQILEEAGLQ
ncbi:MAG: pyruvate flavodoxin/ferredoxin oxidoreductase [Anaerolineae bacterium]|nr:pyruvate flavodoxin/ferredoxin oxidoreductase [Anaerolineae bacterium]